MVQWLCVDIEHAISSPSSLVVKATMMQATQFHRQNLAEVGVGSNKKKDVSALPSLELQEIIPLSKAQRFGTLWASEGRFNFSRAA
jgi:hypothetical protein